MPSTHPQAPPPPPDLLRGASLFLDFDGTLVDLAPRPDAVVVGGGLRVLVARLADSLDGRLAIISGRSAEQIRTYLGADALSVSGSHGLELHWADGRSQTPGDPAWLPAALERAAALRREQPGVVVEAKPFGVALHYRQAPEAEAACRVLAEELAGADLRLQPGKMVYEVRAAGGNKGDALRTFMADPAMAGTRPVFIGDDATDEPAFRAAAELGGSGILVGPPRETGATYRLPDVAATLEWLETAARIEA